MVIIAPATGVPARYYHRYAAFLNAAGFAVLTFDYRGIGASRPARLAGCAIVWRDWGERDLAAALDWAAAARPAATIAVVGHSIGGFLPGFAANAGRIDRLLTVGAQYAYWRDYHRRRRLLNLLKWHVMMPALTALRGYFPGRRLGWLEDLPAGVAYEWSRRGARMEDSYPSHERPQLLARFAAVTAPILAVAVSDDEFGTPAAVRRGLSYYSGSRRTLALLSPADFGAERLGHFALFHSRHREDFWPATLRWLQHGAVPWPTADCWPGPSKEALPGARH